MRPEIGGRYQYCNQIYISRMEALRLDKARPNIALVEENKAMKQEIRAMEDHHRKQLAEVKAALEQREQALAALRQQTESMEQQTAQLQAAAAQAQSEAAALREGSEKLQNQSARFKRDYAALQEKYYKLNDSSRERIAALQKELAAVHAENPESPQEQLQALQQEKEDLQQKLAAQKTRYTRELSFWEEKYRKFYDDAMLKISARDNAIAVLRRQNQTDETEKLIAAKNEEISVLRKELTERTQAFQREMSLLEQRHRKLYESAMAKLNAKDREIAELRHRYETSDMARATDALRQENERLSNELEMRKDTHAREIKTWQKRHKKLYEDTMEQIRRLENELAAYRKEEPGRKGFATPEEELLAWDMEYQRELSGWETQYRKPAEDTSVQEENQPVSLSDIQSIARDEAHVGKRIPAAQKPAAKPAVLSPVDVLRQENEKLRQALEAEQQAHQQDKAALTAEREKLASQMLSGLDQRDRIIEALQTSLAAWQTSSAELRNLCQPADREQGGKA